MEKEAICISNFVPIEQIAHEVAMAVAIEKFKLAFSADMIKSTRETGYIIDLYYQHKKWAIDELNDNFKFMSR